MEYFILQTFIILTLTYFVGAVLGCYLRTRYLRKMQSTAAFQQSAPAYEQGYEQASAYANVQSEQKAYEHKTYSQEPRQEQERGTASLATAAAAVAGSAVAAEWLKDQPKEELKADSQPVEHVEQEAVAQDHSTHDQDHSAAQQEVQQAQTQTQTQTQTEDSHAEVHDHENQDHIAQASLTEASVEGAQQQQFSSEHLEDALTENDIAAAAQYYTYHQKQQAAEHSHSELLSQSELQSEPLQEEHSHQAEHSYQEEPQQEQLPEAQVQEEQPHDGLHNDPHVSEHVSHLIHDAPVEQGAEQGIDHIEAPVQEFTAAAEELHDKAVDSVEDTTTQTQEVLANIQEIDFKADAQEAVEIAQDHVSHIQDAAQNVVQDVQHGFATVQQDVHNLFEHQPTETESAAHGTEPQHGTIEQHDLSTAASYFAASGSEFGPDDQIKAVYEYNDDPGVNQQQQYQQEDHQVETVQNEEVHQQNAHEEGVLVDEGDVSTASSQAADTEAAETETHNFATATIATTEEEVVDVIEEQAGEPQTEQAILSGAADPVGIVLEAVQAESVQNHEPEKAVFVEAEDISYEEIAHTVSENDAGLHPDIQHNQARYFTSSLGEGVIESVYANQAQEAHQVHNEAAQTDPEKYSRLSDEISSFVSTSKTARPDAVGFRKDRPVRDDQYVPGRSYAQDDLKRIKGIGVLVENKLKNLGVTSYQQLANLTEDEVQELSAHLNFENRIEHENWIEQAKILADGGETLFSKRVDRGEV